MGVVGADVSGCVRLTLDANSRITDVDISTAWRDRVGPDNLSEAILQAAANGMQSAHGLQYEQREMKPTGRPSIEGGPDLATVRRNLAVSVRCRDDQACIGY
mgnify:CR=1 FL=1